MKGRLLILTLLCVINLSLCEFKLKMVIQITRQGASTPTRLYHKSTRNDFSWIDKYGLGELTSVGQRQMYLLGRQTQRDYSTLFNNDFKMKEMYVRTTGYNTTYHSSQALVSGIFKDLWTEKNILFDEESEHLLPPTKISKELVKQGSQTPVPGGPTFVRIDRISRFYDEMMRIGTKIKCPKLDLNRQAVEEGQKYTIDVSFAVAIKKELDLNIEFGSNKGLIACYKVGAFLEANYYSNPETPHYKPGEVNYEKSQRCYRGIGIMLVGDKKTISISGSPLMIRIRDLLKGRLTQLQKDENGQGLKYALFSGHTNNIIALLVIMNQIDRQCLIDELILNKFIKNCFKIDFSSSLNFELYYDSETKKEKIAAKFNGQYLNLCSLGDSNPKKWCSFLEFTSNINSRIDSDWKDSCGLIEATTDDAENIYSTTFLIFIVMGNFLILSILIYILCRKPTKEKIELLTYSDPNDSKLNEYRSFADEDDEDYIQGKAKEEFEDESLQTTDYDSMETHFDLLNSYS